MQQIKIPWKQKGKKLEHFWSVCVGGGRVAEALRADFQQHLEMIQQEMPFQYLRMHGLLHDDMMVYHEDGGKPIYNFQYVDLVFDHWLSIGIRPFVELGFMPYDLASGTDTVFWWKGNITPPKDWNRWEELVVRLVRHLIERYGIDEVLQWYFEAWNEPGLADFWKNADLEAYLKMYEITSHAIKRIHPGLRVGGPATHGSGDKAGIPPIGKEFLQACKKRKLPIDFFSYHPYPTFHPLDLTGKSFMVWDAPDRLLTDLDGVDKLLRETGYSKLDTHLTEWNSSPTPRDPVHDLAFMAPFIVQNNWRGRNRVDSLSFWVVSDIFEENRQGDTPFHGGFGMVNVQGLKKPAYHGYWFLSRLGEEELASGDDFAVTRHPDGRITVLLWNYCHYSKQNNDSRKFVKTKGLEIYKLFEKQSDKQFKLDLTGAKESLRLETVRFDREHGSVFDEWQEMGAPEHILLSDLNVLRQKMELDFTVERIPQGQKIIQCNVPPHGVVLLEISREK